MCWCQANVFMTAAKCSTMCTNCFNSYFFLTQISQQFMSIIPTHTNMHIAAGFKRLLIAIFSSRHWLNSEFLYTRIVSYYLRYKTNFDKIFNRNAVFTAHKRGFGVQYYDCKSSKKDVFCLTDNSSCADNFV